jgi:hypothetical protein
MLRSKLITGERVLNEERPKDRIVEAAAVRLDATITQKLKLRDLEKQLATEDCRARDELLLKARAEAGDHEGITEILTFYAVLAPLGMHPSFILQAWTGWQYRQSYSRVQVPIGGEETVTQ